MMLRAFVVVLILAAGAGASAESDLVKSALDRFRAAFEVLGEPASTEVRTERDEVEAVLADLTGRMPDLLRKRESAEAEKRMLESRSRDIDDRLRQIDFDQRVLESDWEGLARRVGVHNAEAARQHAAAAAAATEAAVASANSWGSVINNRKYSLDAEARGLEERAAALENRRSTVASDILLQADRMARLHRRRFDLDKETSKFLSDCGIGLSRSLALKQIETLPGRPDAYEHPDKLAEKALGDLFKGMAKNAALKGLGSKGTLKMLAKLCLGKLCASAVPFGAVYTVADTFADVALVGVAQRNLEIEKNIFLIGEYATVMKKMIQQQGPDARYDPDYEAMKTEIERLRADLPANEAEVLGEGLTNSAAIAEAFISVAANYAKKPVEHFAGKITNHLNNDQRQTLGKGGVKFFRETLKVVSGAGTKAISKTGSRALIEQIKGFDSIDRPTPTPKMRPAEIRSADLP